MCCAVLHNLILRVSFWGQSHPQWIRNNFRRWYCIFQEHVRGGPIINLTTFASTQSDCRNANTFARTRKSIHFRQAEFLFFASCEFSARLVSSLPERCSGSTSRARPPRSHRHGDVSRYREQRRDRNQNHVSVFRLLDHDTANLCTS